MATKKDKKSYATQCPICNKIAFAAKGQAKRNSLSAISRFLHAMFEREYFCNSCRIVFSANRFKLSKAKIQEHLPVKEKEIVTASEIELNLPHIAKPTISRGTQEPFLDFNIKLFGAQASLKLSSSLNTKIILETVEQGLLKATDAIYNLVAMKVEKTTAKATKHIETKPNLITTKDTEGFRE